jgi:hypothetical protein
MDEKPISPSFQKAVERLAAKNAGPKIPACWFGLAPNTEITTVLGGRMYEITCVIDPISVVVGAGFDSSAVVEECRKQGCQVFIDGWHSVGDDNPVVEDLYAALEHSKIHVIIT